MFFDISKAEHRALVRDLYHDQLEGHPYIVAAIEQEVIDTFSVPRDLASTLTITPIRDRVYYSTGVSPAILLRGFDPNPDLCEPLLSRAFTRTIARILNHRLAQAQINPLETNRGASTGNGSVSVAFRNDADKSMPTGWDAELIQYDSSGALKVRNLWGW